MSTVGSKHLASGLQKTDAIIEALQPALEKTEDRINRRLQRTDENIDHLRQIVKGEVEPPVEDGTEEGPSVNSEAMLGLLGTLVRTRVDLATGYQSTLEDRTIWIGGIPNHIAAGNQGNLESNLRAILAQNGHDETTIQKLKLRYKDPGAAGADHGPGTGQSWCLVPMNVFFSLGCGQVYISPPQHGICCLSYA